MKKRSWLIIFLIIFIMLSGCNNEEQSEVETLPIIESEEVTCPIIEIEIPYTNADGIPVRKPVIYLYPETETTVQVKIDFDGVLSSTYPAYEDGWNVIARPDGTLIDPRTGREFYCLFWEGVSNIDYPMEKGFVVAGTDTAAFLENTLTELGLTEQEANEFIIYWLPILEQNKYNLISFQNEAYFNHAQLNITPTPDTVIRVFMTYKALDTPIEIDPQEFISPIRQGFTVVEWGGAEIQN